MRSFGEGFQQPQTTAEAAPASAVTADTATVAGVIITLRHKRHQSGFHDGERAHHSNADETHGISEEEDSRDIRASSFTEVDGGFSAVVPLDRYHGPTEIPDLHVRVSRYRSIYSTRGDFDAGHHDTIRIRLGIRLAIKSSNILLMK